MKLQTFQDVSPIFIVGHARSGTTLLQMLLNSHPDIAIYSEVHFFNSILNLKNLVPDLNSCQNIDRFFILLEKIKTVEHLHNYEELFQRIKTKLKRDANANNASYEAFYKYLLEEYSNLENSSRLGEKTTTNIRYLEELLQIFPEAKIIHIVRNPKDVLASKIKVPWSSNSIIINAFKWKIDILYGQRFAANHQKSYIEVRYEDLVDSPELEIKRLLAFVNEPFDRSIIDFYKSSKKYVRNEPWKEGVGSPINQKSVGKGNEELSKSQVILLEKSIGKTLLDNFNYSTYKNNISVAMLLITILKDIANYTIYKYGEKRNRSNNKKIYPNNEKIKSSLLKVLFFSNGSKLIKCYSNRPVE